MKILYIGGCADGEWLDGRERVVKFYLPPDLAIGAQDLISEYRWERIEFGKEGICIGFMVEKSLSFSGAINRLMDGYKGEDFEGPSIRIPIDGETQSTEE